MLENQIGLRKTSRETLEGNVLQLWKVLTGNRRRVVAVCETSEMDGGKSAGDKDEPPRSRQEEQDAAAQSTEVMTLAPHRWTEHQLQGE